METENYLPEILRRNQEKKMGLLDQISIKKFGEVIF